MFLHKPSLQVFMKSKHMLFEITYISVANDSHADKIYWFIRLQCKYMNLLVINYHFCIHQSKHKA